eukprot:TRINITY_DN2648_c0_g2_i1.p1 TRINITY_DN2648_c0_g2~~TRINITY_DN2648_c0_g2_i1.p1  ORF type:complete len:234 (-),score=40.00 TRINITY_DN2648_c0_g2_i1:72-773(-)
MTDSLVNLESPKPCKDDVFVTCRICLQEESNPALLISPCGCKGSMKYVHVDCLNTWRIPSPNPDSVYKCDSCKTLYKLKVKGVMGHVMRMHKQMPLFLTLAICASLLCTATYVLKFMELIFKVSSFSSLGEFFSLSAEKLGQGLLVLGLIGLGPLAGMFNFGILRFPAQVLRLASATGIADERTKIAYATDILISMMAIMAGLYRVVSCVYWMMNRIKNQTASPLSCEVVNLK